MSKDKWVRRFSVDETSKHKNGFTIYKITSILFPIQSPEALTVVSVWKRYSDVQRLHACMKTLHAGLHLRGSFPQLPRYSYFKRFQKEVIEDRARVIKTVLEFIAEHQLLFTSTDFVNFLQSGYPAPETAGEGTIAAIRSALQLPREHSPSLLPHQDDDDDDVSRTDSVTVSANPPSIDETDYSALASIPIHCGVDIDRRASPLIPHGDSFESIDSIDSVDEQLYMEIDKITIAKPHPQVKKNILPDLINFDAPSTSRFDDYHTMRHDAGTTRHDSETTRHDSETTRHDLETTRHDLETTRKDTVMTRQDLETTLHDLQTTRHDSETTRHDSGTTRQDSETARKDLETTRKDLETISTVSVSSYSKTEYTRSNSRVSNKSMLSLSNASTVECKTKTEDSYVFEAGYMLNLAARYEDMKEYSRAFECYKAGIEKMLIGVQSDCDQQRRALIKEKTNKYLSYAEAIFNKHLCDVEHSILSECSPPRQLHCPIPLSMLRRPRDDLALYRVLAVLGDEVMLVLHRGQQTCYAMKVIQKIPNNLTEFDEYFLQNTNETRQPILPTVIPYMVSLHSYIESNNLIFLILSYAPGEKLFDYIKNYAKSLPNTPAREVNLENVFTEPKSKDLENNLKSEELQISIIERVEAKTNINNKLDNKVNYSNNNDKTDDVSELVLNSQKLLQNVEKALSGDVIDRLNDDVGIDDVKIELVEDKKIEIDRRVESPVYRRISPVCRDVLPRATVCGWGAQLLTALESLHNTGVICRDLQPSNILLGSAGQIILTYFIYYPGIEMALSKLHKTTELNLYIAPELYRYTYVEERDESLDRVCDFWSFGAIMYELLCGLPLSYYHRSVFTSHTMLQLPDGLPIEVQSLLTQLLTYEPSERLGSGTDGIEEIKRHPYFKSINWHEIYDQWTVPD